MKRAIQLAYAAVRQRCPECQSGRIFRGLVTTNERCEVCGLRFEREPGYFYGAMYLSYTLAFLSTAYWIPMLALGVSPWLVVGLPAVQIVLQIPLVFRYSRAIWLAIDHYFDPGLDDRWSPELAGR
jgi:uncharacterized protein (DUF983 family)